MDSREYVFIFPLKNHSDIPVDFGKVSRKYSLDAGVFLPQEDTNWFTRDPKYPARLLLLDDRRLHIIAHPTSAQAPLTLQLDDLVQLETGTVLLRGWVRLTTNNEVHEILYNTRASRPLEEFLQIVKTRWLDQFLPLAARLIHQYGDGLDIKFRNSVEDELLPGEAVLTHYFQAPVRKESKVLFLRREHWQSGHAVVLTARSRLIWITDEHRQRREFYASISFSAPLASLKKCTIETDNKYQEQLVLRFASSLVWRIRVRPGTAAAGSFCEFLNGLLQNGAAPNPAVNLEGKCG